MELIEKIIYVMFLGSVILLLLTILAWSIYAGIINVIDFFKYKLWE